MNRSGLLVGRALVELGYTPEEAIEAVRRARGPMVLSNQHFVRFLLVDCTPRALARAVTEGMMDRETAHTFARERCLKETTYRHLVSVEGVMRSLAHRFDEDQDLWGLTGLFHDLDQDHTGDDGAQHARMAAGWLREAGVDERVVNGVLAHAYEEYRTDRMSRRSCTPTRSRDCSSRRRSCAPSARPA